MHSLDWYGCDSAPGTIHAMMRYKNYDICALSVKDAAPYNGKLDPAKYSDDKVLFLDGQAAQGADGIRQVLVAVDIGVALVLVL